MQPEVVVLGGSGMLGHKIFQRLREDSFSVVCTLREPPSSSGLRQVDLFQCQDAVVAPLDASDFPVMSRWLSSVKPAVIVNCIGIVKQKPEAHDPIPSITINSLLPHQLASVAAGWGGRLIHFSTDCVFSGGRGNYAEEDFPDARDLYGRTKFLGEVCPGNALTLRTSMIGRELASHLSLLDWFLSQKGRTIRGFKRVLYSGVTTNHLAALVADIIRSHPRLTGLYQVAAAPISKYDLLCLIREAYGIDVTIVPDVEEVSDRSMSGNKLKEAIGYVAPSWRELIAELAADPTPYDRWVH